MTKSVQLQVNPRRFIERVLGKMFEHPGRALSEAMQNSRRAGASEIRIQVATDPADPAKSVVIISDDGSGILDWSSLLIVAQSGWETELADKEDAFGVGFAALLFSAREVIIRSRGHELRINQAEAIKGVRFAVTETRLAPAKGTLIRMEGYALSPNEVKWHAERCAAGFALPVHLGEELLPAPFRLDGRFIQKNVGAVWFNHVGAMPDITRPSVLAYYQGLPITVPFHKDSDVGRATIVVHIDEAAYPATSPDRSRLCNSEVFERDLIEAVRKHWQDFLDGEWRSMPAEAFVERYWRLARRVGSDALLNATPVLPEGVLSTFDGSPVLQDRDELFSPLDRAVTRAEVEARAVVLARDPDDEDSDETRAFLTLAYRLGWVFVSDLPSSHWANDYVVSIDDVVEIDGKQQRAWSVDVGFEVKAQRRFVGCEVSAELALVDRYAITLADAGGQFGYSIEEESRGLYWDGCMVVPAREDGAMLVRQASRYQTEFEEFLEAEYEEDDSALQNLVAELRGRSAAETVYMLLNQAAVVCKPGVPGSVCVVIFGAATDPGLAHKETHVFELSPASIDKLAVKHPIEAASLADAAAAIAPLVSALTGKTARDSA